MKIHENYKISLTNYFYIISLNISPEISDVYITSLLVSSYKNIIAQIKMQLRHNYYRRIIFRQILHIRYIYICYNVPPAPRWSFTSICTICAMVMTLVRSYSHVALENGTSCAVSTPHLAGCYCLMLRRRLLANCVGTHTPQCTHLLARIE